MQPSITQQDKIKYPAERGIKTKPKQTQTKLTAFGCQPRMSVAGTQKNIQNKANSPKTIIGVTIYDIRHYTNKTPPAE